MHAVAVLGLVGKAEVLQDNTIGSCAGIDCNQVCGKRFPGYKGICDPSNNCTCYKDYPEIKTCNLDMGRCDSGCSPNCCFEKCLQQHPGGIGNCDASSVQPYVPCRCSYPC